jgi:Flp pilus assembly protein TadD
VIRLRRIGFKGFFAGLASVSVVSPYILNCGSNGQNGMGIAFAEESHPGMNAEVLYSEAVIALSRKQTQQALQTLDQLLKEYPQNIEGLELKALTLKNEGNEALAIESYKKLIQLKPSQERGPYHFELGMIYNRQKNTAQARYHFAMALKLKTNPTVSHFFLAMLSFNEGRYPNAEFHFRRVTQADQGELKLISHYYLGLIELKTGYSLGATRDLNEARKIASVLPESKNAQDIKTASDQILAPFGNPQWFANISMLGGYDSNISQIPTSLASSNQVSGRSTGKTTLSAGVGHMTAPLDTIQYVASYRFNINKNLSSDTRNYEFATNTLTLNVNYLPLNPTQAGFKVEGNFMFQNQPQDGASSTDANARYSYGKYNLSAEIGPYFRYQPSRQISTELDIYFRPQKYYTTDDESGNTLFTRASVRFDYSQRWFNPGVSLSYENNHAKSGAYRENSIGIGVSNLSKITPADNLNFYFDFTSTKYPDYSSTDIRADKDYVFRLNHSHTINAKWTLLADLSYTLNRSSVPDSYTYNRLQSGLGISWSM